MNVVNVGDELTQDQINAINAAGGPSATNPFLTRTNTFDTADAAVRITQTGTGEAFRVEDVASPDNSPFVITSTGTVGIGVSAPASALDVLSGISTRKNLVCSHPSSVYSATNVEFNENGSGVNLLVTSTSTATGDCVRITNNGTGNSFVVNDVLTVNSSGIDCGGYDVTAVNAIVFHDATVQYTAAVSFDQALNTTDSPAFVDLDISGQITLSGFSGAGIGPLAYTATDGASSTLYTATGIIFADGSEQTTAYTGGGSGPTVIQLDGGVGSSQYNVIDSNVVVICSNTGNIVTFDSSTPLGAIVDVCNEDTMSGSVSVECVTNTFYEYGMATTTPYTVPVGYSKKFIFGTGKVFIT